LDQGNVDVLRERAFSGLASYGHPDEPRSAGKEVLLTILLLAALGGAGWWTYKNYIGVSGNRKPPAEVAAPGSEAANATPSQTQNATPEQASGTDEQKAPPPESAAAEDKAGKANTVPEGKPPVTKSEPSDVKAADAKTPEGKTTAEAKAAEGETGNPPKAAAPTPTQARHEVSADRAPADTGEAFFRRGEGYLYGRGGAGNCGNAIKYLKMASDQQHAKARSAMGTMYATGHCVPRDLPSSYRWFALALQADPNNTIVEKNLRAVWNQMTPPERQMATKSQ
jgi:TPR repeat protein